MPRGRRGPRVILDNSVHQPSVTRSRGTLVDVAARWTGLPDLHQGRRSPVKETARLRPFPRRSSRAAQAEADLERSRLRCRRCARGSRAWSSRGGQVAHASELAPSTIRVLSRTPVEARVAGARPVSQIASIARVWPHRFRGRGAASGAGGGPAASGRPRPQAPNRPSRRCARSAGRRGSGKRPSPHCAAIQPRRGVDQAPPSIEAATRAVAPSSAGQQGSAGIEPARSRGLFRRPYPSHRRASPLDRHAARGVRQRAALRRSSRGSGLAARPPTVRLAGAPTWASTSGRQGPVRADGLLACTCPPHPLNPELRGRARP